MDKKTMLHYLRNPYGIDETEMRKARLQAVDELERLYEVEQQIKDSILLRSSSKGFLLSKVTAEEINENGLQWLKDNPTSGVPYSMTVGYWNCLISKFNLWGFKIINLSRPNKVIIPNIVCPECSIFPCMCEVHG